MTEEINEISDRMRERMLKKIEEFRSNPELIQQKIEEAKKQSSERYKRLKEESGNMPIIDNTTSECPRCGYNSCGKAGFLIKPSGKFQRRRCMVCGYVYTNDWRN